MVLFLIKKIKYWKKICISFLSKCFFLNGVIFNKFYTTAPISNRLTFIHLFRSKKSESEQDRASERASDCCFIPQCWHVGQCQAGAEDRKQDFALPGG